MDILSKDKLRDGLPRIFELVPQAYFNKIFNALLGTKHFYVALCLIAHWKGMVITMRMKSRDFLKIIIILVLLSISIVMPGNIVDIRAYNLFILIDITMILFTIYDRENIFNLLFIFMFLLALFHFGQVFLQILGLEVTTSNAYDLYRMYSGPELVDTLTFCLVAYNFIALIGYLTKIVLKHKEPYCLDEDSNHKSNRSEAEVYEYGRLLFWILLIPIIIFDITISISGISEGYIARYTYKYTILSDMDQYFPMAIICIIVGGNKERIWKPYYFYALARMLLQMFTVGNRGALIIYLILYELARHTSHKKEGKKSKIQILIYIVAVVLVCIMISFVSIIRGGNRITLSAFFGEYNVFSLFLSEFGSTLITPILANKYIDNFGMIYGKNYLGALAVLIPLSSRFMSGIRAYMNVGAILNPYSPLKGALGGSLFADMIIAFGNMGVWLAIPLGYVVAKVSDRIHISRQNNFIKSITIYISYGILLYVRGNAEDIGLSLKRVLYLAILYIIYCNIKNRRKT